MDADKTALINNIVMSMYESIGQDNSKRLEGILYLNLQQYDIATKSTEIVRCDEDITEELIKRFLISKRLKNCTNRTLKYYATEIKKFFDKTLKTPMDITTDDIRMHFLKRQIEDKVSPVTINNERRAISSFFAWLATEEIRLQNPMLKIDMLKEKKGKKEAFSEMEIEKMRVSIKDDKNRAIFETLLSTWARVSEVANIRTDEIYGDKILVHGKGDKDRYVFLTPRAEIAIKIYLEQRNDNNPFLFPQKSQEKNGTVKGWWKIKEWVDPDKHTDIGTIENYVRGLGKKNGIKSHPHKFRRTGATMALRRGMPLMQVSKTLGHESIETTQIYLDISDEELRNAHMKYC